MQWQAAADRVRGTDLKAILPLLQAVPDRNDKNKWHTSRGVISITGGKFINWNEGCSGGGAIDLVIHLKECDFKNAVLWLLERFPCAAGLVHHQNNRPNPGLRLPPRDDTKLARVTDYLVGQRHIDRRLVKLLLDSGCFYADRRANAVFLLLGKEKSVVGAELRGTTSLPWRGMAPGSKKELGYFSIQWRSTSTVVLCESAIDAISCLLLRPDLLAISTSGANPDPPWLKSLLNNGYSVFCGFDSDLTGDRIADRMSRIHPAVKRLRPAQKDWNDVLASAQNRAESNGQFK
jgi:hypothetical protein